MIRCLIPMVVFIGTVPSAGIAADFVRDVRPIFEKHCYSCHGPAKQRSGFRLDVKSAALKGGDTFQPAILPGKAIDSPLMEVVTGRNKEMVMPPKGERLTAAEIATLRVWIDEGAVWPDGIDAVKLEDKRDHWSFRPRTNPVPPTPSDIAWPRNGVDRFILARLESAGMKPASPADRTTWLRRVTLDLTGLPPTPDEVVGFLNDSRANAREIVVDALLSSPRHGERWAQHWLDVVRFADTHGFEVNTERPNAWPYRDYVIDAINADTPYDQFIREQIVGDRLQKDAATGFLVTASVLLPGQIGADEPSKRLARQDSLDEIVINVSQTFLALSVGCARCHDHKFDPVSHREYYGMQAFFAGVEYGDREFRTADAAAMRATEQSLRQERNRREHQLARLTPLAMSGSTRPAVHARANTDRFPPIRAKRVRFTIDATNSLEPCIDELEIFNEDGINVALAGRGTKVTSSGDRHEENRHELRFINDGKYGNTRSWMSKESSRGWVVIEFPNEETIERVVWGRDRDGQYSDRLATKYRIEAATTDGDWMLVADSSDRRKPVPGEKWVKFSFDGLDKEATARARQLLAEIDALEPKIKAATATPKVFAGRFRFPDTTRLLHRGDPEQAKDVIAPTTLAILGKRTLPSDAPEHVRRTAIADWISSPDNPLTARVMVNRIWQGHFGSGLVETASDFGRGGTKPSHPELLDWLASEFIRSGWSMRHMHRLIVLSATYAQSSRMTAEGRAKDADTRLLWRFPSRRLEAEAVRDSMLAVSGRLNLAMGGRGFNLFDKRGGLTGFTPIESFADEGRRRMIYAHRVRREKDGIFGAFDCPDNGQSTSRRRESTTPIQALSLFNSPFTRDEAKAFADRVRTESSSEDVESQIRRSFWLALNREPTTAERRDIEPIVREYGLETLGRVLFNSNEFLYFP